METIISPVDRTLLEKELTKELFVRDTNNGHNQIYIFTHDQAPNLMRELGRLREYTFREASGGTGKCCDIDEYDTAEVPFRQLIVWSPDDKEIVGGYRFIFGKDVLPNKDGHPDSPTARLFKFSEKYIKEYWPETFELGRSFVQPMYQPTINLRKGMYSLDNLWDGLGAITILNPEVKYFFGKITMYPSYDSFARDMILYFMLKYFPDKENLVKPRDPLILQTREKILKSIFSGVNYDEDYKILVQKVRRLNEGIPPLVNAYMNLSGSMRTFGTAINDHFGMVEETAIMVTIADIYDYKKDRHISSFKNGSKV
ncbi:MAG: GNAT family N-acetyltransferase [Bacteroidales bacterium]|nr:GNAT family N-acetyltransferase [Bacteroidales bacterium]MCF8404466.1 GNAT family N-acetyltransferase [Bacteroidales bacterium]